jgi:aminoglycoside phosphotransferase (APT) family kinase protein
VTCPDPTDPVTALLARHGICDPWAPLPTTGLANRVYATANVVLRVATDHPEAVEDARTESVAAPAARAAGVETPRLLVFDDSRVLVDRPYSIWERVQAEPLPPIMHARRETWDAVADELVRLHRGVRACDDPDSWLDRPGRSEDLAARVAHAASMGWLDAVEARELERWVAALAPALAETGAMCFLHNDVHAGNLLCAPNGVLRALIDWGDAGWGDPTLELAQVPLVAAPVLLASYEARAADLLGDRPEARALWDRLEYALEELPGDRRLLAELRAFVGRDDGRWRRAVR